ncbi:hypothetical protein [Priestia megaterium]|jgi:hypothetical protein|uniref:hypothetical protein n=1 Tax=Priestia megaterium TaxID=1404 RepID=UPI0023DC209A|nr:hypothetical protein [Priestia megaterium]MDF2056282.1 hypothetical protein [Priestia megaterium]MDF2060244.1 hypothetical protein [Priestia megaterium]
MNNLRWLTSLFNFGRNNRGIFGKRRNNRGRIFSLLGLGVGAVATYGITRGRGTKMAPATFQTMTSRRQMKNGLSDQ